ncbi:type 2 lanthipeptide synthetase LanM family protein [Clostridium estertheticum]|uniref:type 2 lanthipeptide synthetase LanM family protein n=1 Tax=Clostridium estertheticum TaxID=238834 RepID=UPI00124C0213|nr:type 2 lanthipeptide synthetase LanM family protein [Clostridium estertheticum]MBZ9618558.1 type 2 lantipeptide synthetase LanM family protein [Clostridium estertheticum subsp. laramiense]WAG76396.1 type 2 lantipeptide synthetase LanM family protein [Clostridium estertheticum]
MSIKDLIKDNRWSNALYISEKIKYYNFENKKIQDNTDEFKNIGKWMKLFKNDKELMMKRVDAEGISLKEFDMVADELPFDVNNTNFIWHKDLTDIFTEENNICIDDYIMFNKDELPFFEFAVPFLKRSIMVMKERLNFFKDQFDIDTIIKIAVGLITEAVVSMGLKTLTYELTSRRINGKLKGDTREDRYDYFVKTNLDSNESILKLLIEYPVLARLTVENAVGITENIINVIETLVNDKEEIESYFNIKIDNIRGMENMGDLHDGGKCVLRFNFAEGINILYKPRDLSIDESFQKLLEWFNEKGIEKDFKTMKVLNKGTYGWQEFMKYEEVSSNEKINNFFERQGEYIALLHILNGADMHCENIIANGEYPVFVDLESLFHNEISLRDDIALSGSAVTKAEKYIKESVLKTAMLPVLDANFLYDSDISGIAGDIDQILNMYDIQNKNTDEIKIVRTKITVNSSNHLPSLNGEIIIPKMYVDNIKSGFTTCYDLMRRNKEELAHVIKSLFSGKNVRTIIRSTLVYRTLLEASSHPKYLRNGISRNYIFDYLWLVLKVEPDRMQSIPYEIEDLLMGDIPLFRAGINNKNLINSNRIGSVKDAFNNDAMSKSIDLINSLSDDDFQRQWDFIETTINTKYFLKESFESEKAQDEAAVTLDKIDRSLNYEVKKSAFLNEAERIAESIMSSAIIGDDKRSISWINLGMNPDEKIEFKIVKSEFYNGVTGIGMFYAYLAKETGNQKYKYICEKCINTSYDLIMAGRVDNISAFMGMSAFVYLAMHVAKLFNREDLIKKAEEVIDLIETGIEDDEHFDIMAGCSSTLIVCAEFYKNFHYEKALELARKCGDHLVKKSVKSEKGVGWITSKLNNYPIAGMAHGNAGIALSLMTLYDLTKDDKYLNIANEAIAYENSLYDEDEMNWKDLRSFDKDEANREKDKKNVSYWCNGAPGIGMARVAMLKYCDSAIIKNDVRNSVQKTINEGFKQINYCLCHGDLGSLELILLAAEKMNDKELKNFVYTMGGYMLDSVNKDNGNWKSGIPGRVQIPNFMLGLSGIGYELLRLYNNEIPSALILEGPAA